MLIIWAVIFCLALFILIKAADYFTEAAEKIGLNLKISPFIIGVTVVAIGTSLPELATSLLAVFRGHSEVVAANALGSNITNILLIIGICALVAGVLKVKHTIINLDLPLLAAATGLITVILWDQQVTTGEGIVALLSYLVYAAYLIKVQRHEAGKKEGFIPGQDIPASREKRHLQRTKKLKFNWQLIFYLIISVIAIYFGADWVVKAILNIAAILNVPSSIAVMIGVGAGTSLPELIVSLVAVKKKQYEIALGNIFGSNIFNVLVVIGIPSLFGTLKVDDQTFSVGIPFLAGATLIYVVSILFKKIDRWEGGLYLAVYALFIAKLLNLF